MFHCRSCRSTQGKLVLDLGELPLANNFLKKEDLEKPEPRFPLQLYVCCSCWLLQILDTVSPVELFSEYIYFSSNSKTMLEHAKKAVNRYIQFFELSSTYASTCASLVVEIASNDGYLLQNFLPHQIPCLGIEPAANIAKVAQAKGINTLVQFFGSECALNLAFQDKRADLILGNNVFAHVPNINDFVDGLRLLLKSSGTIILEFPYVIDMLTKTQFDTIYHEHVFYFSLVPLQILFGRFGLSIYHVERLLIHGGSLRIFVSHRGEREVQDSVHDLYTEECLRGVTKSSYYDQFALQVKELRSGLLFLLKDLKEKGHSIAAFGASAKGTVMLNYLNPPKGTIDFITDCTPGKQGLYSPGLHLPIVCPELLLAKQPDYTLLLVWNFLEEVLKQQELYRQRGGKFILPVMEPQIL